MSQQGGMFAPQEQEPQRQVNTDPREQPHQQTWQGASPSAEHASYDEGYGGFGQEWRGGEKVRPVIPPTPIPVWQWIVGAVLVLALASVIWSLLNAILGSFLGLVGIVIAVLAISQLSVKKIELPVQRFSVMDQPKLIVNNSAGSIRVHRGAANTVEVKATKYINGWFGTSDEGAVDFRQNGDEVNIATKSYYKWSPLGGLRNVNLEISVPEFCDVQFEGNAGTVTVEDVRGQVRVDTNAGTIDVKRATLENRSILSTNAGTINVRDTVLKGQVGLHTNAGTVDFVGALDQQGYYRFDTNAGTITVTLPASQSFALEARTDVGTINNQFGSNIVGPAPQPRLELVTNLGTVTVRRGR